MPTKVHIPGLGDVPRGGLIAGIVVGIGGGIYLYIKHKNSAAATPAAGAAAAFGYGYGGFGYGGYGYNNPAFNEPYIGGEFGYGGVYGYGQGVGYGVGTPYPPSTPTQLATTNAAWAQAAESYLANTGGYDPATVAGALGIYLSGGTPSATQQSIIEAAIAFQGYPPTAGPSGYPPSIHVAVPGGGQTGGSGGGGTTTATKVTVPVTFGMSANTAISKLTAAGFQVHTNPVRNPQNEYKSTGSSPRGGSKAAKGSAVTLNVKVSKRGK
jgi:hypothetical protein